MDDPELGKIELEEIKETEESKEIKGAKEKKEEMPTVSRSRLRNSLVKQSRRNIILAVVGIIGIVTLVFLFGVPLLINLSLFF